MKNKIYFVGCSNELRQFLHNHLSGQYEFHVFIFEQLIPFFFELLVLRKSIVTIVDRSNIEPDVW